MGYVMPKVTKVAISLPAAVLDIVEKERKVSGESRSRIFCRAIELLIHEQQKQAMNDSYIQAYRDMPETEDEVIIARRSAGKTLSRESWE
jgi:metal-responsive CopG/Arc/MetJ family transcriptional regulator